MTQIPTTATQTIHHIEEDSGKTTALVEVEVEARVDAETNPTKAVQNITTTITS